MRSRRTALLAVAFALPAAAPTPAAGAGPLERFAPIVVHHSDERSPLTSVEAAAAVPGVTRGAPEPTLYGRRAGPWLQYWMFFAQNLQDRGFVRTGRHEGDWELVQFRLRGGRLTEAVYAQHSGAERCPIGAVLRRGERPLVFLAHGSHAAYFRPGLRDRTWPDPNDRTDARGLRLRPRLVRVTATSPPWMRYGGRWGGARAGWIPGEESSPRGPAFQPQGRWTDPDGWAAAARACTRADCDARGECDATETAMAGGAALVGVAFVLAYARRRMRRLPLVRAG